MTEPLVFGLELGGTKCLVLRGEGPHVLDSVSIATTGPAATLAGVDAVFEHWQKQRRPDALGIASFGPAGVSRHKPDWGHILQTPKAGWAGTDVVGRYRRMLGVASGFDTDVNAAAVAEALWGGAMRASCSVYITIGTGVGVGICVDGRPVHGYLHPELGHLKARRALGDTFAGICPFHGDCIEGLISGPAIAARAGMPAERIDDRHPMWSNVIHDLGELLSTLILAASPEKIGIGGGVACARPWLVARARQAAFLSLGGYIGVSPETVDSMIEIAGLRERAGPLGAIALGLAMLNASETNTAAATSCRSANRRRT